MTTHPTRKKKAPPTPLREVVAENLRYVIRQRQARALAAGEPEVTLGDIADGLGKSRQWLYRRTTAAGPVTTEDIDILAAALEVSTDDLTRRGT